MGKKRKQFCVMSDRDYRVSVVGGYTETVNAGDGFVEIGYAYFKGRGWRAFELTSGVAVNNTWYDSMDDAKAFVREHISRIASSLNVYMRDEDSIVYRCAQAIKEYQRRACETKTPEQLNGVNE